MIANQQGIANAVKAASDPASSTYGQYLSLSTLQKKYGAPSSRRSAVVGAFKPYGVTATVDVTHLRRRRNDQHQEGPETVRHEVGPVCDRPAEPGGRAPGQHTEAGVGSEGQRRHRVGSRALRHTARVRQLLIVPSAAERLRLQAGHRPAPGRSAPAAPPARIPWRCSRAAGCSRTSSSAPTGSPRCRPAACRARARASRSSAKRRRRSTTSTRFAAASASPGLRCRSTAARTSHRSSRARWTR